MILSRFAGIAKFQGTNETRGFTITQINLIMDTVACLHLVSSKILIQVVDELDLFAAFSNWIRYEIDRLASDSAASPDDDKIEKEASIDHSKVLQYLQTAMTTNSLAMYFDDSVTEDDNGWKNAEQGLPIYDLLDKQLQKQERGAPYLKALPRVDLLCKLLAAQASTIFGQIAEAEKRNVLFGKVHEIGVTETTGPVAMRMSAVVSLQRSLSNLADMLRIPLCVGLMLLLCQKPSRILVCKLLSKVKSKIKCLSSSDYLSRTLHREWYQPSSKC